MIVPMIKTISVLLNLAFKCRLVNETLHSCRLAHRQNNWSRTGNITNFTNNCTSESFFFFSQDSKEMSSLIFVSVIKKVYQENIPFMKQIHIMYVFIKGIIWKTNCYWHMYFFFDLYNVGKYKKKNNFEHVLYPQFIKSEEKKII